MSSTHFVFAAAVLTLAGCGPALAAFAIALNPSSGRAAAYNGSFDLDQANQGWHECRRKGGVTCKTAAAICD